VNVPEIGDILRALRGLAPSDATERMTALARSAGALDVVAYLVDFEQTTLVPVPDRGVHIDMPEGLPVDASVAGRALALRRVVSEPTPQGTRLWVPILEGSECTGVLMLTVGTDAGDETLERGEEIGMLAGAVIAITARQTDLFNMVRRRRAMSLPASMQWDLLPPLHITTHEGMSTGLLVPAYDVGGDSFDHAVNGFTMDVAIMDAMGHGLTSSMTSALAMGSYRHDRREGQPLRVMHEQLDAVLDGRFQGRVFVTGQLAQLDLRSGQMAWVNAGHPRPLLLRRGQVVEQLGCRPSLPWGLGGSLVEQAESALQPGDTVVFYSDGVVEGRSGDDALFGIDRFVDIIEQAAGAGSSPQLTIRRALQEVVLFQGEQLRDDATIVWLQWLPDQASA
jgi:serine phosphatase RsbU (regulator of sigma subunit)